MWKLSLQFAKFANNTKRGRKVFWQVKIIFLDQKSDQLRTKTLPVMTLNLLSHALWRALMILCRIFLFRVLRTQKIWPKPRKKPKKRAQTHQNRKSGVFAQSQIKSCFHTQSGAIEHYIQDFIRKVSERQFIPGRHISPGTTGVCFLIRFPETICLEN